MQQMSMKNVQKIHLRATGNICIGRRWRWCPQKCGIIKWLRIDTVRTPFRLALWPWQMWRKRCKKIINGQRNQWRIVCDDTNRWDQLPGTNTCEDQRKKFYFVHWNSQHLFHFEHVQFTSKCRIHFPDFNWALAHKLTQIRFQIIHWFANHKQDNDIWN